MATNEQLIPIPGRLHSVATEGHVAGADEIYDDNLSKLQSALNADSAYLGSDEGQAVIPGFDPETDTLHVKAQILTTAKKDAAASNIFDKGASNGMGRVILKATDNFKTVVESATGGNTVFVIQYDFTLTGNVTIPANCVLLFDGGSISNSTGNSYTLTGNNTLILSEGKCFTNIKLRGNLVDSETYLKWFVSNYPSDVNDVSIDNTNEIIDCLNSGARNIIFPSDKYLHITQTINYTGDAYLRTDLDGTINNNAADVDLFNTPCIFTRECDTMLVYTVSPSPGVPDKARRDLYIGNLTFKNFTTQSNLSNRNTPIIHIIAENSWGMEIGANVMADPCTFEVSGVTRSWLNFIGIKISTTNNGQATYINLTGTIFYVDRCYDFVENGNSAWITGVTIKSNTFCGRGFNTDIMGPIHVYGN